jgi:membrane-associated PAP2 superfamily phosphatase
MNRTGLCIALAVAAIVGLTFGFYPQLDLKASALVFEPGRWSSFWRDQPASILRDAAMWLVAAIAAPAFIAILLKLVLPRRRLLVPGRAILLLTITLALGPGLVTNIILKDYWGRARPADVVPFGGKEPFLPWWDWRGNCRSNCSFVAGEPSGAFWTLAPAALAPAAWRPAAYAAAVLFGAGVGVMRMALGAHFFTDVVFAGVFTFLLIWTVHGLLYRWRPTRTSDEAVERAIERASPVAWLQRKPRAEEKA